MTKATVNASTLRDARRDKQVQVSDVRAAHQAAERAMAEWRASPIQKDRLGREFPLALNDEVMDALDGLMVLCATQDVEPEAQEAVLAFDDVSSAYAAWSRASDSERLPGGSTAMWMAWDRFTTAVKTMGRRPPLPEPVTELFIKGVKEPQIAKIYGWRDASGFPDVRKVAEELARPGTHFDPATWVHPAAEKRRLELEQRWQDRAKRLLSPLMSNGR